MFQACSRLLDKNVGKLYVSDYLKKILFIHQTDTSLWHNKSLEMISKIIYTSNWAKPWGVTKLWLSKTYHTNPLLYTVWHTEHISKTLSPWKRFGSLALCYFIFILSLTGLPCISLFSFSALTYGYKQWHTVRGFTVYAPLCTQTHSSRVVPTYLKSQFDILSFHSHNSALCVCVKGILQEEAHFKHLFIGQRSNTLVLSASPSFSVFLLWPLKKWRKRNEKKTAETFLHGVYPYLIIFHFVCLT